MKEITRLKQEFPDIEITEINDGHGANLRFPAALITIWFKKRKYGTGGNWYNYTHINEFIADMDRFINPEPKVVSAPYIEAVSCNGTQSCIDHINRKIEFMQKNNGSNTVIAMLKSLVDELKQYL